MMNAVTYPWNNSVLFLNLNFLYYLLIDKIVKSLKSMKNKILELRKSGMSYSQISEEIGCSKSTISYHCKRAGLEGSIDSPDEEKIKNINEYYKSHTLKETSKKFSLSRTTIIKYVENKRIALTDEERKVKKYEWIKSRRQKLKEIAVEYKGGKCEKCGYYKCNWALDFHHLDPNEKDFSFSQCSTMSWDKLKDEIDKCIMVCSNCHREIHYELHLNKIDNEVK